MAAFFSRPVLSDLQFRQPSGETLTLSGDTRIVGKFFSKGTEIDGSVIGAPSGVTGHVLTFINNKIQLAPPGTGITASQVFTGGTISRNFGNTQVNSAVQIPIISTTIKDFIEKFFFPSIPPSISISGGVTRMFGNNSGFTLNWSVTRRTLPLTSITVNGLAVASGFFVGLPQNGTLISGTTATITTPNTNQTYILTATTASESQNISTSMVFSHKRYFYGDNQNLLDDGLFTDAGRSTNVNLHDVGGQSEFASNRIKSTFAITLSNQFFYYVYPVTFGNASFTFNGLENNDLSFKDFTFTNPYGFALTFRMYRSNNILNGTFNVAVN